MPACAYSALEIKQQYLLKNGNFAFAIDLLIQGNRKPVLLGKSYTAVTAYLKSITVCFSTSVHEYCRYVLTLFPS